MLGKVTMAATLAVGTDAMATHGRQLSQIPVGKYSPSTNVMDHANIDLDQMTLESAFGSSPYDFAAAKAAWEGAGHSKVSASCTLAAGALVAVAVDDTIAYTGVDGSAKSNVATAATALGETTVVFKTQVVQDNRDSRVDTSAPITVGGVTIGTCTSVTYAGGRTLKGFSTNAKDLMYLNADDTPVAGSCAAPRTDVVYRNGCPYTSYKPYFDYYCAGGSSACNANGDYVNQWVSSAADGTATGLDNFNIDFSTGAANYETYRKDFLKKVSKFAGAWMYAVREFEDAIDDCALEDLTANGWSDDSVHAWDEGVAFYVGGRVTSDLFYDATTGEETKPPNDHYLAYTLGNKRCANFKTCGRGGDQVSGEAYINYELWKAFGDGRDQILAGNCAGAVPVKNHVVNLMTVPLVQGSLRYAYYCRNGVSCTAKALGELGAFVASVLPQVHACDAAHAATIAAAADPSGYTCTSESSCTGTANDFAATKAAFEACYPTMGLSCSLVGGLYDANELAYKAGASPCSDSPAEDDLPAGALIAIIVCGALAGLLLACILYVYFSEKKTGKPMFFNLDAVKPSGGVSTTSATAA